MSRVVALWTALAAIGLHDAVAQTPPDVRPRIVDVSQCRPSYPAESVAAQEEGITHLRAHVTAAGELRGLSVVRSSGHERLDQATLGAIGACRFSPGTRAGVPVDASTVIEFKWRLEPAPAQHSSCRFEYPPESIRAEEQGTTELRMRVSPEGKAQDIQVSRSSGHPRLDAASVEVVKTCVFRVDAASSGPHTVQFIWKLEDAQPAAPTMRLGPVAPDAYQPRL